MPRTIEDSIIEAARGVVEAFEDGDSAVQSDAVKVLRQELDELDFHKTEDMG